MCLIEFWMSAINLPQSTSKTIIGCSNAIGQRSLWKREMRVHLLYMRLTHSPTRGTIKCLMFSWEHNWMALLLYTLLMCNYNSDEKRAIIIALMRHSSFAFAHYWKALITMFNVTVTAWASVVNAQRCLGTFVQLENSHKCLDLFSSTNGMSVFYWWGNFCERYVIMCN